MFHQVSMFSLEIGSKRERGGCEDLMRLGLASRLGTQVLYSGRHTPKDHVLTMSSLSYLKDLCLASLVGTGI